MEALSMKARNPHEVVTVPVSLSCSGGAGLNIDSGPNEAIEDTTVIRSNNNSSNSPQLSGKVIRVIGDGRCLFRSLVTAESWRLQISRRNDYGRLECREDADDETCEADLLRASVVRLMFDNLHFYSQLENGLINADQPVRVGYQKFMDRLVAMSRNSTMPGDLELNAAAIVIERQVIVLNSELRVITVYGQDRYPQSVPLAVRYTRLRPDVGHYDAVVLDANSEAIKQGVSQADASCYSHFQRLDFSKMTLQNIQEQITMRHPTSRMDLSDGHCYFSTRSSTSCHNPKLHTSLQHSCISMTTSIQPGRKRWLIARKRGHFRKKFYKSSRRKPKRKSNKKLRKKTGYKVFWEYKIPPRARPITAAFSVGESLCVLCKKVLISSIHSWMKCYRCGRVAHTECVIKYSPCIAKNGELDFYFLCQLCVQRKICESE